MYPYSSPYIIPNNSPHNPFPHSLLRTRQKKASRCRKISMPLASGIRGLGFRVFPLTSDGETPQPASRLAYTLNPIILPGHAAADKEAECYLGSRVGRLQIEGAQV